MWGILIMLGGAPGDCVVVGMISCIATWRLCAVSSALGILPCGLPTNCEDVAAHSAHFSVAIFHSKIAF